MSFSEYQIEMLSGSQTEYMHRQLSEELIKLFPNVKKGIANSLALTMIVRLFLDQEDIKYLSIDSSIASIIHENIAQFSIPDEFMTVIGLKLPKKFNTHQYVDLVASAVSSLVYGSFLNSYLLLSRKMSNFTKLPIGFNVKINDERYIPVSERKMKEKQPEVTRNKTNHLRLVK